MTWKAQNDSRLDQSGAARRAPRRQQFTRTKVVRVLRFVKPKKGQMSSANLKAVATGAAVATTEKPKDLAHLLAMPGRAEPDQGRPART
jgi:hypothetical protein